MEQLRDRDLQWSRKSRWCLLYMHNKQAHLLLWRNWIGCYICASRRSLHCVIHIFLTIHLFYRRPRMWEFVRLWINKRMYENIQITCLNSIFFLNSIKKKIDEMILLVFLFCYSLNINKQIHCKWKRCCDRETCERPVTYDKIFWSLTRILLFDKITIQFLHQLRSQKTTG